MYEELVKRLREESEIERWLQPHSANETPKLLDDAADAIEELDMVTANLNYLYKSKVPRWIPVTKKLPEDRESVLVDWWNIHCPKSHNFSVMSFYKGKTTDEIDPYKGIMFCDQWGNNKVPYAWGDPHGPLQLFGQDVTHWMPLPEPPKEET